MNTLNMYMKCWLYVLFTSRLVKFREIEFKWLYILYRIYENPYKSKLCYFKLCIVVIIKNKDRLFI